MEEYYKEAYDDILRYYRSTRSKTRKMTLSASVKMRNIL